MITFAIPGYKRPDRLDTAVRSIAAQIKEVGEGRIFISEHSDCNDTWAVLNRLESEFPFIEICQLKREHHHDYSHNFRHIFSVARGDWIWTFGNDDVLLPGSLARALEFTKILGVDFIHVSEESRTENTNSVIRGSMIQLAQQLGWLDTTGFISCNIVKSEYLRAAANLDSWDLYARNAFVQSCVLLEVLHDKRCGFVDTPMVRPQDKDVTPETLQMWQEHKTATRYFYVDDALKHMRDRGFIPATLSAPFFRYHSYYLWDRLITNMITQYLNHPNDRQEELWDHIRGLFEFLDPDDKKIMLDRETLVKNAIDKHCLAVEEHRKQAVTLEMIMGQHNIERFGFTYLGQPKQP